MKRAGRFSGPLFFIIGNAVTPIGRGMWPGRVPYLLLVPHVDGKTLRFEVQHHKCHGCTELGPNVKFRMELVGPDDARLWKLENQDGSKDLGPGLKLVRRTEPASAPKPAAGE